VDRDLAVHVLARLSHGLTGAEGASRLMECGDARPGRVWCTCEVLDLLLVNARPADARAVAEARLLFDAAMPKGAKS